MKHRRWLSILMFPLWLTSCVSSEQADQLATSGATGNSDSGVATSPGRPTLAIVSGTQNFAVTSIGQTTTLLLTFVNTGTDTALIDSAAVQGTEVSKQLDLCSGTSLAPSDTCAVTLSFTPLSLSSIVGTFTLGYRGRVTGTAYTTRTSFDAISAYPQPALSAAPASWDFGVVATGTTVSKSLIISNANSGAASFQASTIAGSGYAVSVDNCNGISNFTSASAVCTITVTFTPAVPGAVLGQLTLNYRNSANASLTSVIALSGYGDLPQPTLTLSPNSHSFGSVATNSNSMQPITVANNSSSSATLGTLTIAGSGFTINSTNCNNVVLTAGANCTATLKFAPVSLGSVSGTLTVPYTSAQNIGYTATAALGGTGITPTVGFTFVGFNGGITHTSNLTATGVTLTWTAATGGPPSYYKITQTVGSTSTTTTRLTPVSTLSYNVTSLTPNTTYAFKINAYDNTDIPDSNTNTVTVTTPNVTGSTFNGWSDVVALGSVYTDIGLVDTVSLGRTGSNRLERNLSQVGAFDHTQVDTGTGQLTVSINPFSTGQKVRFYATDAASTAPTGLTNGNTYFVISVSSTAVKLASSLSNALSATPIIPSTTGTGNFALMPTGIVRLGWDAFTISPSGSATSYNIYRGTTPGSKVLYDTSATQSYVDYNVSDATNYYYGVQPVVSGVQATASAANDSEIQVFVPPQNMALIHRWIANREACTNLLGFTWPGGISRSDHYSCAYTWGTGYGLSTTYDKSKWDIGYSLVVDRWQNGCKMGAFSGSTGTGAPGGGVGSTNDVYFKVGTSLTGNTSVTCYVKDASTGWVAETASPTNSQRALMKTNFPGYSASPLAQSQAYSSCQQRSASGVSDGNGNTSLRLMRLYEAVLMRAAQGVNVNYRSTPILSNIFNGLNLPANGSCNVPTNNTGFGGTTYMNGVAPPVPSTWPNSGYQMISGSHLTRACHSRYEISNLWDAVSEWTGTQYYQPNAAAGYFVASSLDAKDNLIENFTMNGSMGIAATTISSGPYIFALNAAAANVLPLFGIQAASVSAALGSRNLTFSTIDYGTPNYQLNYTEGNLNGISLGGNYNGAVGIAGRYGFSITPATKTNSIVYGTFPMSNRCVGQVGP
jgi:hypothetical protein